MTLSFSPGAAVAVTCSESGFSEPGVEDAIRSPAPSGTCGFDVKLFTTSVAASVRISMCLALSSLVLQGRVVALACYATGSVVSVVSVVSAGTVVAGGRTGPARRGENQTDGGHAVGA